jgi:hypothetical protein
MLGDERDPERAELRQRLGRLRREAFGRTVTPDDEARASAALRELTALEAELRAAELPAAEQHAEHAGAELHGAGHSDSPRRAAHSAEPHLHAGPHLHAAPLAAAPRPPDPAIASGIASDATEAQPASPAEAPAGSRSRLRRALPIIAVGLASAAIGVGLAAVGLNPMADASTPGIPSSEPGALEAGHDASPIRNDADIANGDIAGGDIAVAQRWFDKAQTPDDLVDLPDSKLDLTTTRLIQSNAGFWRLLVARDEDGQYCLIIDQPQDHLSAFTCRPPDGFTASGLRVTNGEITAYWDGFTVSTSVRPAD